MPVVQRVDGGCASPTAPPPPPPPPPPPAAPADAQTARKVSLYLARVIEDLVQYEDTLLSTDGFFAREEHFEARIEVVLGEFTSNKRAQALFTTPAAISLLITQLTFEQQHGSAAMPSTEHLRRRQQFVFAAAVLLSSSLATGMILKEPPLLHLLWRYVERDAPLDNVQLLYWCRVVGLLILNKPPPHPEMVSPVGGGEGIRVAVRSLGLPHLLRTLLVHLRSDAICALLRYARLSRFHDSLASMTLSLS